ncbi:MAG: chitobiase/beta-hexosaminidase C-terminal domain-containing protein [Verrucomicrobia bacterium]|nr:chitobiase/beta-hexosaminidase C-terminal domain-containing protein [Verrucomicrobiota bacterium]
MKAGLTILPFNRSHAAATRERLIPAVIARWSILLVFICLFGTNAAGQVNVQTLGGGPLSAGGSYSGFADGDTLQQAQFNRPSGCAVDDQGYLYVADRNNNAVRRLDVAGNWTSTVIVGLYEPIDVAIVRTNDLYSELYVLEYGIGSLLKRDRFGEVIEALTGLDKPTAMAFDGEAFLYIAEEGGAVERYNIYDSSISTVTTGFSKPNGLAVMNSGCLAVADAGTHAVYSLYPDTGGITLIAGVPGTQGFRDGPGAEAKFNSPGHIVSAPDGSLILADTQNHRVRRIDAEAVVSTVYGIAPDAWGYDNLTSYKGWWDGDPAVAESRSPLGVGIGDNGSLYVTETYYHIVREVTGLELGAEPALLPPEITPASGYFPMGRDVTVTNPNSNVFFDARIFYTTDGTVPTTNSLELELTNNMGVIQWREKDRDLSSLRVRAFAGAIGSEPAGGLAVETNRIGVPSDIEAGVGAVMLIPVVAELKPGTTLGSLQFRVEVEPLGATPALTGLDALSFNYTNEFFQMVGPTDPANEAEFSYTPYQIGATRGMLISFAADSDFGIDRFGVVALLKAPVPVTAREGDKYSVSVAYPSGTSDGVTDVPLKPMPAASVTVTNLSYLVGDTEVSAWYHTGDFGDGRLLNNDVNNAYNAALGIKTPFIYSDIFDAMDAFPVDSQGGAGGDGMIRYLDWQIIQLRSVGLIEDNWYRQREANGSISAYPASGYSDVSSAQAPAIQDVSPVEYEVFAGIIQVDEASSGEYVDVPLFVNVKPGCSLSGMQFLVSVTATGNAPGLTAQPGFIEADGIPSPSRSGPAGANSISAAWNIGGFEGGLQGSNALGVIRFAVPSNAVSGDIYSVNMLNADGAADMQTQYDFETLSAGVKVESTFSAPQAFISEQWRERYFGYLLNPCAAPEADPDFDGVSNLDEYAQQTDPVELRLRITREALEDTSSSLTPGRTHSLQWYGVTNTDYVLEVCEDLTSGDWSVSLDEITGSNAPVVITNGITNTSSGFFRVRKIEQ